MLDILKKEKLIDDMTLIEVKKWKFIDTIDSLFSTLGDNGVSLSLNLQVELKKIYDLISKENICCGNYRAIKVRTSSGILSLIGKWNPPTYGQMKIGEVVEDIYTKIRDNVQGEWYYYTGKTKNELAKGRYAYKLIVLEKIAIFVNLNREISYHILMDK